MTKLNQKTVDILALRVIFSAVHLFIGYYTGLYPWKNSPYNSYALQAQSWLCGRLDVDYCPYLEQAVFGGKYYISFPPFPSYVMLPFVAVMGLSAPQGRIAFAAAFAGAVYALKLAQKYAGEGSKAVFWAVFLYLGSNLLYLTMDSSVWFIAQNFSAALSLAAIWYAGEGKTGASLFAYACAVGCRPFQAVYLPLLLRLLFDKIKEDSPGITLREMIKSNFHKLIPAFLVALSYMILNYARFGNILEFGHNYLPEFTRSTYGQFSLHYLLKNLKTLLRLPYFEGGRLYFHKFDGNNIFIINPILISFALLLVKNRGGEGKTRLVILLAVCHIILLCLHRTMGGYHFGHRYIRDILPAVFFALMCMAKDEKKYALHILLCALGIIVNVYGTLTVLL